MVSPTSDGNPAPPPAIESSDGVWPYRVRGRRWRRGVLGREMMETSPGSAWATASRMELVIWSRTLRRLVGTTTTARCDRAISWVDGIRTSAVMNRSNCSRSAAASSSPFLSDRHDIWTTVRASWPTKMCRSCTGRHSSIRIRKLCRGFDDLVRGQRQNRQHVLSPQARPRFEDFVQAQPIGQVIEQHCNRHPGAAKTRCSAHHRWIDRNQVGCLHGSFRLAAARLSSAPDI